MKRQSSLLFWHGRSSLFLLLLVVVIFPNSCWAKYDWKCNLHCYNDGECRHGKGKFGSYAGVEESDALPWDRTNDPDTGMYCACPAGFTGLQCEIVMKTCGNDEHTCFNGSACAKETAADGTTWWRCECDAAASVLTAAYAGKYCEHIATVFCNKGSGKMEYNKMSYCTNGGKCKEKDHEGQKHVGCICQEGFEGEHCEINNVKNSLTLNDLAVKATSNASAGMIVGIILGVGACIMGVLFFREKKQKKRLRRKQRLENAGIQTSSSSKFPSFRVREDAEVI